MTLTVRIDPVTLGQSSHQGCCQIFNKMSFISKTTQHAINIFFTLCWMHKMCIFKTQHENACNSTHIVNNLNWLFHDHLQLSIEGVFFQSSINSSLHECVQVLNNVKKTNFKDKPSKQRFCKITNLVTVIYTLIKLLNFGGLNCRFF